MTLNDSSDQHDESPAPHRPSGLLGLSMRRQAAAVVIQVVGMVTAEHVPAWTTVLARSAVFGLMLTVACGRRSARCVRRLGHAVWRGSAHMYPLSRLLLLLGLIVLIAGILLPIMLP